MPEQGYIVLRCVNPISKETDHVAIVAEKEIDDLKAHVELFKNHDIKATYYHKKTFPKELQMTVKEKIDGWRNVKASETKTAPPMPAPAPVPAPEPAPAPVPAPTPAPTTPPPGPAPTENAEKK